LFFMFGFASFAYLIISKIIQGDNFAITNKPFFYIGLVTMIIGVQLFLTGFLAELLVRNAPERNNYGVEERLGLEKS